MNNLLAVRSREQQYLAEVKVGVAENVCITSALLQFEKTPATNVLCRRE